MARGIPSRFREAIGRSFAMSELAQLATGIPSTRLPGARPPLMTFPQAMLALPLLAILFVQSSTLAQQPVTAPPPVAAAPAGTAAPAEKGAPTQQDLDQLLAPIALYPDNLIAQILMAATYPLEVVEAARWAETNKTLKDKALEDALLKQPWDPAVKAIVAVPQVLKHMNDNLSWMQKLGDAVLYDEKAVLATVQGLRGKAQSSGTLKSTPEQSVKTETQDGKTVYIIESSKPETVYVPTYNPATAYGAWPYPAYPPYSMYPPYYAYPYGGALAFTAGVFVGAAIWGNCNWGGGGSININNNNFNQSNRTNIGSGNSKFNHNADHRKGVSYGNSKVANQYGRGSQGAQGREQARGRDGGAGDRGAGVGDRSAGGNRGAGGDRGARRRRPQRRWRPRRGRRIGGQPRRRIRSRRRRRGRRQQRILGRGSRGIDLAGQFPRQRQPFLLDGRRLVLRRRRWRPLHEWWGRWWWCSRRRRWRRTRRRWRRRTPLAVGLSHPMRRTQT